MARPAKKQAIPTAEELSAQKKKPVRRPVLVASKPALRSSPTFLGCRLAR